MADTGKKVQADEDSAGAPEWMVTFSDCMTLLLTFFVLLLTFSSFDDKVFRRMETSLAEALPSVGMSLTKDREAFTEIKQIKYNKELAKGSEKPTLEGNLEANPKEETEFLEFQNQKVFVTPSSRIFWGKGTLISTEGRRTLSDIAELLRAIPNRIIISENEHDSTGSQDVGLQRTWAITEYLTDKHGLDKKRFGISTKSTIPEKNGFNNVGYATNRKDSRRLEIVILERSIYR
jgi:chemotaxis protein MotB